jgi:hypothetical protein
LPFYSPFTIHAAPVPKKESVPEPLKEEMSVAQLFEQMKSLSSPKLAEIIKEKQTQILNIADKEQGVLDDLKKYRRDFEELLKIF